ncbi:RNA polymerase sigma factor [Thalassotalea fusca]
MNQALHEVFNLHHEALLAFIAKRLHDPQLAKDILHDLYLKVQNQPLDSEIKYPKAYLYRMANNLVIDVIRRQSRQEAITDDTVLEQSTNIGPERLVEHAQRLSIVQEAMKELPEKTRDVFHMQRLQQIEKREVANELGISVNMVEKHLRRAVQYCRNKLYKLEK